MKDIAKSLKYDRYRLQRIDMLVEPKMAPLNNLVSSLRAQKGGLYVPDFDPMDGGVPAQILFLFEKPGPQTEFAPEKGRYGSGFISRNNNDQTAESTFRFMIEADIPRESCLIWNAIPWWNGTRKIAKDEQSDGAAALSELLSLLPMLKVIVLVGIKAQRVARGVDLHGLHIAVSFHPSPLVRGFQREKFDSIPAEWRAAWEMVKPRN